MKITVVGAGFVGEATGKGLAKHNHEVSFVDIDQKKVDKLREEGFESFTPVEHKELTSEVTMFSVPTPTSGRSIDFSFLRRAVADFAFLLRDHKKYHVVVIRSTVPPGTTSRHVVPLIEKISGKKAGKDFGATMQPEYLREATAQEDFERPWFLLIGQHDKKSGDVLEKIYRTFDVPIERCSTEEAEFQKYVHNVYNAVKIAFFNEMRIVANKQKWDADTIFKATAESAEGMWNPLYGTKDMGPFDGACLPKDTRALLQWGDANGYELNILRSVIAENLRHEKIIGKNKKVRVNYLANITL